MKYQIFTSSLIAASAFMLFSPSARAELYSDAVTSTPGLVGYWQLGETSGNYADSSSQGNTGVPGAHVIQGVPGPRPSDGFLGFDANHDAAGFNSAANGTPDYPGYDDSQGYIDVPNPGSGVLDPRTGNYSVSLWFQVPSDSKIYTIASKGSGAHDGWLVERLDPNEGIYANELNVNMADPGGTGHGPVAYVAPPTWQNLVFVLHRNGNATPGYSDSGISMYVNGVFIAEDSTTAFDPAV
ncbi:MAG TPA: LamG-like jellyroll fold domain-containing protein, partial [Tepidisphaeraceae bacterium]|nr:LamG-like jellyroll fold domain-containing protein [Tepidisphaeraceae bacterium]